MIQQCVLAGHHMALMHTMLAPPSNTTAAFASTFHARHQMLLDSQHLATICNTLHHANYNYIAGWSHNSTGNQHTHSTLQHSPNFVHQQVVNPQSSHSTSTTNPPSITPPSHNDTKWSSYTVTKGGPITVIGHGIGGKVIPTKMTRLTESQLLE